MLAALAGAALGSSRIDALLEERTACETDAADRQEGKPAQQADYYGAAAAAYCDAERYTAVLVDLGDAYLNVSDLTNALEAYELAAKESFDQIGKESQPHSTALLRLASTYLSSGEYRLALRFLGGWLRTERSPPAPPAELHDALAKQAEAAALEGHFAIAKEALERLIESLAEENLVEALAAEAGGGDDVTTGRGFSAARRGRMHMLLAIVLQRLTPPSLEGAERQAALSLELHLQSLDDRPVGASGVEASVEASLAANLRASLLNDLQQSSEMHQAAQEALRLQTEAAGKIGFQLDLEPAAGESKTTALTRSFARLAAALFEAFQEQLVAEGRAAPAAAALASLFGEPPEEEGQGGKEEL